MSLPRPTWRKFFVWAFWLIISLAVIIGLTRCGGRGW